MKLSCLQENLSKALGIVSRAVATRTTLPIANNVLLATDEGRLKLAGTNLEITITHWIGAKIEAEGSITVPARILNEFVTSLPNDRVDMEFQPKSRSLELKCARFEARISGMDAEDFPRIPEIDDGTVVQVDPDSLKRAINRVAFAAATDDSRPVLTGVNVEIDDGTLTLAAADGFRLSVDHAKLTGDTPDKTIVIIPARALAEVNRLIGESQEPIQITVNQARSQVLFKSDNVKLTSQLIQGTFPNYSQLIPTERGTRTTVDGEDFLRATRAAAIFARDASGIVRLQVSGNGGSDGRLAVSARAEEVGDDVGEIDAQVEGDGAKIAFNSKYLTEILSVLGKGEVVLETNSPSSPGLIRPKNDESFTHVVMPMYVQW